MADPVTPNFGLTLCTVGADADVWGTKTNANWTAVDTALQNLQNEFGSYLPTSGGTVGSLAVGGWGINYTSYYPGHWIGFGWDGSRIGMWVDNSYQGEIASVGWVQGALGGYYPLGGGTLNGSLVTGGTVQAGYLHSTGNGQIDGSLNANGSLTAGYVSSSGNVNAVSNVTAAGVYGSTVVQGGTLQGNAVTQPCMNGDQAYQLWAASNGWWLQFTGNYYIHMPNSGSAFNFVMGGSQVAQMTGGGDFHIPGYVYAGNVSDERTKRDVKPYRRGLAEILQLASIAWRHNGQGGTSDDGRLHYGWSAQAVLKVIPEAVYETPEPAAEAYTSGDGTSYQGAKRIRLPGQLSLDREPLIVALFNAVQEMAARIAALEAR